ncbi:uncharacterized protein LOC126908721 isoform X1 [Daktulosphaira vitifoliae]|uniref:uncharacterized protein LOC126908721 isoform X1 n=1 Tax=Daktulosphaira vitifoliae TaxID=58002 RepID=UPI0021AA1160|nr:uncharacterized protein LOC126908721 isoform X1 [Daktulosphaira vitifoliae]
MNSKIIFIFVAFCFGCSYCQSTYDIISKVQPSSGRQLSFLNSIYNAWYCRRKTCPKWRCQDDSAIIHGHCCGCPNAVRDNVPVLCSENLKCPLKMNNLCQDYSFMITCCCTGH